MFGPHRNHEAIVAQRDVVFSRFGIPRSQNLLQALLDRIACLGDACPNAPQRRRRIVADFSVRQHASPDCRVHVSKIAKRRGPCRQQRKLDGVFAKLLSQPSRCFQQRRRVQELARLQRHALTFDAFEPALRISERAKS